jgi:hypothetical protein
MEVLPIDNDGSALAILLYFLPLGCYIHTGDKYGNPPLSIYGKGRGGREGSDGKGKGRRRGRGRGWGRAGGRGKEGKGSDGKRREGREEREGRSLPKRPIPPQLLLNYNGHSILDNPILYISHYTQIIQSMCTFYIMI